MPPTATRLMTFLFVAIATAATDSPDALITQLAATLPSCTQKKISDAVRTHLALAAFGRPAP